MDSKQIDRLVAEKVMGWGDCPTKDQPRSTHFGRDGTLYRYKVGYGYVPERWSPSTDIAAAFEVVEKMKSDGWYWEISKAYQDGGETMAVFCKDNPSPCITVNLSIPLAICLAALRSVGVELGEVEG